MKKRRKTGIVLLILIIGIAGWQAYSYIERATRPEPAVVYTVGSEPFKFISDISNGKINIPFSTYKYCACTADGARKWAFEKNTSLNPINNQWLPWFIARTGESQFPLACSLQINATGSTETGLGYLDPRTGKVTPTGTKGDLLYTRLNPLDSVVPEYYLGNSTFFPILRWSEMSNSFEPVLEKECATITAGDFLSIEGYSFCNTIVLVADRFVKGAKGGMSKLKEIDILDTEASVIVSRWIVTSDNDKPDPDIVRVGELKSKSKTRYAIDPDVLLIRPPIDNLSPVLLLNYRPIDNANPDNIPYPTVKLYELNPDSGVTYTTELQLPEAVTENGSYSTGRRVKIGFLFYDSTNDISYLTFGNAGTTGVIYGLKRDLSWTLPLTVQCDLYHVKLARDGSIWYVDPVPSAKPSKTIKVSLIRFDPITGKKDIVVTTDSIFTCFTLD